MHFQDQILTLSGQEYSILSSRDLKAHRKKPESLLIKHLDLPDVILHNHKFLRIFIKQCVAHHLHTSQTLSLEVLSPSQADLQKPRLYFSFSYIAAHYWEHQLYSSKNIISWENENHWRNNKDQQLEGDFSAITHSVIKRTGHCLAPGQDSQIDFWCLKTKFTFRAHSWVGTSAATWPQSSKSDSVMITKGEFQLKVHTTALLLSSANFPSPSLFPSIKWFHSPQFSL